MTMTDSRPRPPAFWADARFLLGIVLVIGSIAAVWAVVATARQTAPALVATRTVVAGQVLSATDLEAVDIGLGAVAERYLAPGELVPGSVATRTLPRGDLIPRDAVGPAEMAGVTTVVLRSSGRCRRGCRPARRSRCGPRLRANKAASMLPRSSFPSRRSYR